MRILQLCSYFLPHKGGIESVVYNLSKEMVTLGHDVTVISSAIGSNIKEEFIEGIKIKRVNARTILKSPIAPGLIFALIKEKKPDIIHLHHPHPFFLEAGILYAKLCGIPIILHCHGAEITMKGFSNIFAQIYNNIFLRLNMLLADRIIVHSNILVNKSRLLQLFRDKLVILKLGVDTERYSGKKKSNLRKELKIDKNNIILFVGALREYKRVDLLINAFNDFLKEIPNSKLLIVGSGEREAELEKLTEKLSLQDRVIFFGFVDDKKLKEFYSIADVFVLPSPNIEEGFGLVALEAAAMGIPIIVTQGAGISEHLIEDGIGKIIEPYSADAIRSALLEVITNKKALVESKKAKNIILKVYSWKELVKDYLNLYQELIRKV